VSCIHVDGGAALGEAERNGAPDARVSASDDVRPMAAIGLRDIRAGVAAAAPLGDGAHLIVAGIEALSAALIARRCKPPRAIDQPRSRAKHFGHTDTAGF
jgi:hypothetical protein